MNIKRPSAIGALLGLSLAANAYCIWRVSAIEGTDPINRNQSVKSLTRSSADAEHRLDLIENSIGVRGYDYYSEPVTIDQRVKMLEEKTEELSRRVNLGY